MILPWVDYYSEVVETLDSKALCPILVFAG